MGIEDDLIEAVIGLPNNRFFGAGIPELLRLLNLQSCTVTIDAMGCQKAIAAQIREQKRHYVSGLKRNQSGLEADMAQLMDEAINLDSQQKMETTHETREKGYGRYEERSCQVVEIPAGHPQRSAWKVLCTLVIMTCCQMVARGRTLGNAA